MIKTDIPGGALDDFAKMALLAREEKVATVSLVPPRVNAANPDLDEVHEMVRHAIDRSEGDAEPAERRKNGSGKGSEIRSPAARSAPATTGTSPTRPTTSRRPADRTVEPGQNGQRGHHGVVRRLVGCGHDAALEVPGEQRPAVVASDRAARLGEDQGAGQVVPRHAAAVDERGRVAGDQVRVVDAAAGPGQLGAEVAEVAADPLHGHGVDGATASVATLSRSPFSQAPAPRSATYDRSCWGCQIQPRVISPAITSATMTAWSGEPWTKFLVPSTGSTVKPRCAAAR